MNSCPPMSIPILLDGFISVEQYLEIEKSGYISKNPLKIWCKTVRDLPRSNDRTGVDFCPRVNL